MLMGIRSLRWHYGRDECDFDLFFALTNALCFTYLAETIMTIFDASQNSQQWVDA